MKPLQLLSEPYSQMGNISAQGISKILGAPQHNRLQVLVRETVQNTWDARHETGQRLIYNIRLRTLAPQEQRCLCDIVFSEKPSDLEGVAFEAVIKNRNLKVLEVNDFGTTGLGGPVHSDEVPAPGEAPDFVDFIRNIGSPRDKDHGGGTYGYGKSSIYRMSSVHTICVHSVGVYRGETSERFIGCRLSDPFNREKRRYTGRHWWGSLENDVLDPVQSSWAGEIADGIGFPKRAGRQRGTSIMIVDPVLEGRSPAQAIDAIRETLLWHFWPKYLPIGNQPPPMEFHVHLEDEMVAMPRPADCGPIAMYTRCLDRVRSGEGELISSERPKRDLGRVATDHSPVSQRPRFDTGDTTAAIPDLCHHIALMRPAELVVKYVEGPPLPSELFEYGGVFVCAPEVEQHFADSEPPTHDDWVPDYLERPGKTFVRGALKGVAHASKKLVAQTGDIPRRGASYAPLGALGDSLGKVLFGVDGNRLGGETHRKSVPNRKGSKTAQPFRYARPTADGFQVVNEVPCAIYRIDLSGDGSVKITGSPKVVLEGGASTNSPEGVKPPRVIAWLDDAGVQLSDSDSVEVAIERTKSVAVAVSLPEHCAINLGVSVQESG